MFDEAGAQDQLGQQHAVDEFDDVGIAPEGQCRLRRGQRMQQGQTHQQGRGDQQPVGKRDLQGHEEDQVEEDLVVQRPAQQQQWQVVLERFIPDRNEKERAQQRGRIELQAVQHARRFHGHAGQQQGAQPVQRHDADQPAGEELRRTLAGDVVDDEAGDDEEHVHATAAEGGEPEFGTDVADDHQGRGNETQGLQRVERPVGGRRAAPATGGLRTVTSPGIEGAGGGARGERLVTFHHECPQNANMLEKFSDTVTEKCRSSDKNHISS